MTWCKIFIFASYLQCWELNPVMTSCTLPPLTSATLQLKQWGHCVHFHSRWVEMWKWTVANLLHNWWFLHPATVCLWSDSPPPPLKSPVYNLNCATLKGFALLFLGKVTIQTRKYDIMLLKLGNWKCSFVYKAAVQSLKFSVNPEGIKCALFYIHSLWTCARIKI